MKQKIKKKLSSQPSSLIDQYNFYINFFAYDFTIRVFMKIFEFFVASAGAFDPSEIFSIVQDIRECSKMTIKPTNYRKSTALFVPDICYSEKSVSGT